MRERLALLAKNGLGLPDIQHVIGEMAPLSGACEFLGWLRGRTQEPCVKSLA